VLTLGEFVGLVGVGVFFVGFVRFMFSWFFFGFGFWRVIRLAELWIHGV